mmetsp:Transcript_55249/g.119319  ORF Transcript_55249/g.119319 Transcript_55249/m.119319 type:complete len:306 (-) Transcript_55249:32-949(-)
MPSAAKVAVCIGGGCNAQNKDFARRLASAKASLRSSLSSISPSNLSCNSRTVLRTSRRKIVPTRSWTRSSTIACTLATSDARIASSSCWTRSSTMRRTCRSCSSRRLSTSAWNVWICSSMCATASCISDSMRPRKASSARLRIRVSKTLSSFVPAVTSATRRIQRRVRIRSWTQRRKQCSLAPLSMAHCNCSRLQARTESTSASGRYAATSARQRPPSAAKRVTSRLHSLPASAVETALLLDEAVAHTSAEAQACPLSTLPARARSSSSLKCNGQHPSAITSRSSQQATGTVSFPAVEISITGLI